MDMILGISAYRKETKTGLRNTIYTAINTGKVKKILLGLDKPEDKEIFNDIINEFKDYIIDVVYAEGLGANRNELLVRGSEENEDYICLADSHLYFITPVADIVKTMCNSQACDFKRFDFGFDVENNPLSVLNRSVHHFGQFNIDRLANNYIFSCEYKYYANNPFLCFKKSAIKELLNIYGGKIIPWQHYGADMEQIYVSIVRRYGRTAGKCIGTSPIYGHRATVSNTEHEFWKSRWTIKDYSEGWYQANACFLALHIPRELWNLKPRIFEPDKCKLHINFIKSTLEDSQASSRGTASMIYAVDGIDRNILNYLGKYTADSTGTVSLTNLQPGKYIAIE
ncbi:hypothetical protein D1T48_gp32 [Thermoproteus tenax virus 1]|uniref:Uncharacterized 38.7 kDa protein n=1 Tax=Thermoproteus tenax virus 1 (strain KRA1) TaxID=10480 RepID=YORT_TTV1K|nr:hypothetical protein D1T48_gp32 [Thermoproteus tenax virus 1]P19304.1 RecName: Full=Uncharacterized 38.7 kDa protein [Thermoproteus tenax virus 1 (STRAIN KRA1)]CAA33000.1 unnamed protein product [Thermoproteus tenax virus 1]